MRRLFLVELVFLVLFTGCVSLRDTHERLHSVLWMQTAAEYRILARSAYAQAREAIDKALTDKTWTAALEQTGNFQDLPPAIILDIDETVLDNSQFDGRLIKERTGFRRELWDQWVEQAEAPAVPGALEFISYARQKGITIFFVTNRRTYQEPSTRNNLTRLGIELPASLDTVLSEAEQPNNWQPDKASRRSYLAERYRILLLVGDDLADFLAGATNTPEQRIELAYRHANRWGHSWFLIPNPTYGSWEASLYRQGLSDEDVLEEKRSMVSFYD